MIEPHTIDKNHIIEHEDWTMFVHTYTDKSSNKLIRDVTLFRKIDEYYQKSKEFHKVNLYPRTQILALLEEIGFQTASFKQYGDLILEEHHFGFLCTKLG